MHGALFCQLELFVIQTYGRAAWSLLLGRSDMPGRCFQADTHYPDEEMLRLIETASAITAQPAADIEEAFGFFLAPTLLNMHVGLISARWRTLDILLNTEHLMHTEVRKQDPLAAPPRLLILQVGENKLQLDYRSPRKLGAIAKGIVRGIAAHFGETVHIAERIDPIEGHRQMVIDVQPAANAA